MSAENYIALFGALIALVAACRQMKKMTDHLRLQNFIEYTKRYQEIFMNLPADICSPHFDLRNPEKKQKENTTKYIRAYFDLCSEEYFLYVKKCIHDEVWTLWKDGIISTLKYKAFYEVGEDNKKDQYFTNNDYIEMVDDIFKKNGIGWKKPGILYGFKVL